MKNFFLLGVFAILSGVVKAQYSLRLVVTGVATKQLDEIYIAGNFNNWNPYNDSFKLKPFGRGRKAIVLKDIPAGDYQFKFTRGSWKTVETTAKGADIANRDVQVNGDTSVNIAIEGWKDDFPDKPKPNTATAQVRIMDTAFFMPQLNRYRRIWVYLPKSYSQLKGKSYPVLYMQDGQNLFNEQTAPFGEWGVDECLDSLQQQTGKECIVIGIDNGGNKRTTEYNPYDNQQYGKGEGAQYVEFMVKTLKPYVDQQYRTIKDAQHTFIAGSSLGGLISLYAQMKYPNVFSASGIFSPAFWIAPQLNGELANANWSSFQRFFFYAGKKESETMVSDMEKVMNIIKAKNQYRVTEITDPLGQHSEKYWREEFPYFYKWLMQ
ncbi:MAG TPA: alpha/beta hydrolase-fold protein [Chitinophagaceae bacterium]|nr:alpha/beta hydrolase-fold protein [Chitinophagaceae bacterium]